MNAVGISLSGIRASSARVAASAANIARANATSPIQPAQPVSPTANLPVVYQPVRARSIELAGGGVYAHGETAPQVRRLIPDLSSRYTDVEALSAMPRAEMVSELAELIAAKLSYGANLSVFRTVDRLQGNFVDRWA
ncbi:MAG TPA: hypothetical protein VFX27_07890 [Sphingobium sp.]|nr:hypothetical protein [Sphingobium sp.]